MFCTMCENQIRLMGWKCVPPVPFRLPKLLDLSEWELLLASPADPDFALFPFSSIRKRERKHTSQNVAAHYYRYKPHSFWLLRGFLPSLASCHSSNATVKAWATVKATAWAWATGNSPVTAICISRSKKIINYIPFQSLLICAIVPSAAVMTITYDFPLWAEVGMALQCPVEGVLSYVSEHFIMQLVHCAVGYSAGQRWQGLG